MDSTPRLSVGGGGEWRGEVNDDCSIAQANEQPGPPAYLLDVPGLHDRRYRKEMSYNARGML